MRRSTQPLLPDRTLAVAWQSLSLLLGYPDEELLRVAPTIVAASRELPAGESGRTPLQKIQGERISVSKNLGSSPKA